MKSARRILRTVLLVQALAAVALAGAAMAWGGMPAWQALAVGAAFVALVRLAINMNNFVVSAVFASPTPRQFRVRGKARLRMLWEEFRSSMLHTSWHMPRASGCRRIYPDAQGVPVLLVHGYGCNGGYWAYLRPRLERARISHATVDLEPVAATIDSYVPLLERAVEELRAATGAAQVALVAHSMGGLVVRAWMREHGHARVARVITLGTPHFGTGMANFGLGANAVQMRWRAGQPSAWLQELAASEDDARRALVTSIFSHHDNIIAPQTSSQLPGARNLAFGGIGHVALGCNARVLDAVMAELGARDTAAPSSNTC